MPLINSIVEISLKWIENCMLTTANTATFKISDAKLYIPIVIIRRQCETIKIIKQRI